MKLFIYADPHWSSYSSIVRSRGEKYSTRLENLIKTMNWIEIESQKQNCDAIVCLGDFFDKSELNSEEISALQEIKWSNIRHYMIVGNHEMGRSTLELSSAHLFTLIPQCDVIDFPYVLNETNNTSLMFLPYVLEKDRKPLKEYFENTELCDNKIIFSHNDIAGIQMGNFISTSGLSIEEIEENCNLFINGHLHNEAEISNKIINLGNITGQNFSEDAFKYNHKAAILDTSKKSLFYIDNPYALNFYKVNLTHMEAGVDNNLIQRSLVGLKYPAVVTIKINPNLNTTIRNLLPTLDNIIEHRLITEGIESSVPLEEIGSESNLDHLQKFQTYILNSLENFSNSELVKNELERVSK